MTSIVDKLRPKFGKRGLSTKRAIDSREVRRAQKLLRKAKKRVRVYSQAGFVPNSYKYRCQIQYVEAEKDENNKWQWHVGWTQAQRAHGCGSIEVVQ